MTACKVWLRSKSSYLQHSFVSSLLNILRSAARTCKMYSAQTANNGSYRRDAKISWRFKLIQERLERIWIIEYTIQIVSENSETWYSVQTLDSIASLARMIAVLRTLPLDTEESLGVVIRRLPLCDASSLPSLETMFRYPNSSISRRQDCDISFVQPSTQHTQFLAIQHFQYSLTSIEMKASIVFKVIDSRKRYSQTRGSRSGPIHLAPSLHFNLQHSFAFSLLCTSRRAARNSRPTDRPSPAKTTPTNLTLLVETHIDMRVRTMNVEHEIYANFFFSTPNTWRISAPSTGLRQPRLSQLA
ncbi:hypothetical protein CPB83DRAFT_462995 [Crepidotus variabilis]|uniref:Uncharacterized protein n=1 Tax=Crepidotus variabilis TaxID=179855 RepID=A0A9P6EBN7_9AGAR|nr:hypothetical protein CPB83DRAFT_462995 [Crepidotus variabilis]